MRGTVAKRLRREAREQTVGMPAIQLLQFPKTKVIVVDPKSTRGVYKRLKKQYKQGN